RRRRAPACPYRRPDGPRRPHRCRLGPSPAPPGRCHAHNRTGGPCHLRPAPSGRSRRRGGNQAMHCRRYSKRPESVSARPAAIWPCVNSDSATGDVSAKRVSRAPGEPSPHREPTEIRRTLARNLRQAREAAGLSLRALAKAALYNRKLLIDIEDNAANTTLDTVARLAKALGLTEIDLLLPNMEN